MTQTGIVKNVAPNGIAEVQVRRQTACGHDCADCHGCMAVIGETVVKARNELKAVKGDTVSLESESSKILASAMMVYILPFVLFFVFYFVAWAFLQGAESYLPVFGLSGFLLGIAAAVWWDRQAKKKRSLQFKIVAVKRDPLRDKPDRV